MTRRGFAFTLVLALLPAIAAGQEPPVAVLKGPSIVAVDTEFILRYSGSSGTKYVDLALANGPEPVEIASLFTREGKPVYGLVAASTPGDYIFIVIAASDVDGKEERAYGFWTVHVGPVVPPPDPTPAPTPPPAPTPAPIPVPVPDAYKGPLWGVLVVGNPTSPEQAGLRTNAAIRQAFKDQGANFQSYLVNEAELQTPGWQQQVAAAGGLPFVTWITPDKKVIATTKAATEASIVADLKKIRGVP